MFLPVAMAQVPASRTNPDTAAALPARRLHTRNREVSCSHMLHVGYILPTKLGDFVRANVGKYTSTMEHMGLGKYGNMTFFVNLSGGYVGNPKSGS